jgi:FlaG/FlaF family flagellin (archaellin)
MTNSYKEIPSSAIDSVEINVDNNTVIINYKNSNKNYSYNVENADQFEQQFLSEIPFSADPSEDDKSVGRFINQSVQNGTLQLIQE